MAQALLTGGDKATEMANFISLVDTFFDSVYVVSLLQGKHNRKVFQNPYRSGTDFRLKVCVLRIPLIHTHTHAHLLFQISVFRHFKYLMFTVPQRGIFEIPERWKTSVTNRKGCTDEEKERMLLSQQSMKGLQITGAVCYVQV